MFFLEEQKQRRELLDELTIMREDNARLREEINNLKLFISSKMNLKAYIGDRESIVPDGNDVANENISFTTRDKINIQLTEVRNLLKNQYYNQLSSKHKHESSESMQTSELSVKLIDSTERAIETSERTSPSN